MVTNAPDNVDAKTPEKVLKPPLPEWVTRHKLLVLLSILLPVAGVGAYAGYQKWHEHHTEQFKDACAKASDEKEWKRLGLIAEKWLEWDEGNNDALLYQAEAQFQAGQLEEAAESLRRVSDDYQGIVPALIFRGELLYGDLHRPFEAEATWRRILSLAPDNGHAHQRLITFYAMSLQRDKMVAQIRDAFRHHCEPPEAYAYLLLANALGFTDAVVHVRNWRKNSPDDEILEVAEAIYIGKYDDDNIADAFEKSYLGSGNQAAADNCLKKYPQNLELLAYHLERQIYYGNTQRVIELLRSAPPEAIEDSRFWRFRAWLSKEANDYQQALKSLEKSIELDNFSWKSRWDKATILRLIGETDQAKDVQALAMKGKQLQDQLYKTDGRALTWGLVEEMRRYIRLVNDPEVLGALDARIRRQGGDHIARELIRNSPLGQD